MRTPETGQRRLIFGVVKPLLSVLTSFTYLNETRKHAITTFNIVTVLLLLSRRSTLNTQSARNKCIIFCRQQLCLVRLIRARVILRTWRKYQIRIETYKSSLLLLIVFTIGWFCYRKINNYIKRIGIDSLRWFIYLFIYYISSH